MPRTSRPTATRSPYSAMALGGPLRVLEGGGAEVDPAAAGRQRGLERLVVADAAGHLDLDVEPADDRRRAARGWSRGRTPRRGRRGGSTRRPASCQRQRGLERVAELVSGAGHALHELDGLAVRDVDGGQELEAGSVSHGSQFPCGRVIGLVRVTDADRDAQAQWSQRVHPVVQQVRRRRRRTSRGGTGWPHSGPFSTAATNGAPCSAQVTIGATAANGPSALERPLRTA